MFDDLVHPFRLFSHGEPAEGIPVETDLPQRRRAPFPQVGIHPPLDDAEERLSLPAMGILAPSRPAGRHLHGSGHIPVFRRIRGTVIKTHDDVGAQGLLDGDGTLRGDDVIGAVIGGTESDPLFRYLPELPQAVDLETATVGQKRPIPVHEPVQAPKPLHQLMTGPDEEVIGVGQDDLGPHLPQFLRGHRLDGAAGSHRHEDRGLDPAAPCCQRAAPCRAGTVRFKDSKIKRRHENTAY